MGWHYALYQWALPGGLVIPASYFLTGQKDLVLDDMKTDLVIRSDELVRLCVIEAALLAQINDREIAEMMGMETHPALHAVRSWLIRNPEAKRHYIMMLYLVREIENMPQKGELVFFSDVEGRGHIRITATPGVRSRQC